VAGSLQRALVRPVALLRLTGDRESYREYLRLREAPGDSGREVELRIGRLAGRPVWVREGTGDVDKLWEVFIDSHHLPPAKVQRRGMHLVWDLGAGLGLATAEMALRWPEARVVGVERDPAKVALAKRNIEPWDDRAEVAEGEVAGEFLNGLLERTGGGPVAYVKLDVGGGERELLTESTEWAAEVGCIKVYVSGGYTIDECAADLRKLGFEAGPDKRHDSAVLGTR
jgi:SAM-dependent methyltransferase